MKVIAMSLCAVLAVVLLSPGQAKAEHQGGVYVDVGYSSGGGYGHVSYSSGYGHYPRPSYQCAPPVVYHPPVYHCPPPRPVCPPVYGPVYRYEAPRYHGYYGHGSYGRPYSHHGYCR